MFVLNSIEMNKMDCLETNDQTSRVLKKCGLALLITGMLTAGNSFAQEDTFVPTNNLGRVEGTELQRRTGNAVQAVCGGFLNNGVDETRDDVALQQNLFAACGAMVHTNNRLQDNGGPTALDIGLTAADLNSALQNVAGEEIAAAGSLATESAYNQTDLVSTRFAAILSQINRLQVSALNLNGTGGLLMAKQFRSDAVGGNAGSEESGSGLASEIPLGAYVNVSGGIADRSVTDGEDGFDGSASSVVVGADYRVGASSIIGAALGYEAANVDFTVNTNVSGGSFDSEQTNLSAYLLTFEGNSYIDMVASFSAGSYDLERQVVIPNLLAGTDDFLINSTALGNPDSSSLRLSFGGGREFVQDKITYAPFGRISLLNLTIDGYEETGAQELDLRVEEQQIDSLALGVGARVVYTISTSRAVVLPQLTVEWHHEFKDDERQIISTYVHDPREIPLTLITDAPDRDYFTIGLGVSSVFSSGLQMYADVKSVVGLENITQSALGAGFRYEF